MLRLPALLSSQECRSEAQKASVPARPAQEAVSRNRTLRLSAARHCNGASMPANARICLPSLVRSFSMTRSALRFWRLHDPPPSSFYFRTAAATCPLPSLTTQKTILAQREPLFPWLYPLSPVAPLLVSELCALKFSHVTCSTQ